MNSRYYDIILLFQDFLVIVIITSTSRCHYIGSKKGFNSLDFAVWSY